MVPRTSQLVCSSTIVTTANMRYTNLDCWRPNEEDAMPSLPQSVNMIMLASAVLTCPAFSAPVLDHLQVHALACIHYSVSLSS